MIGNSAPLFQSSGWRRPFFLVWIPENIALFAAGMVQFALIWFLNRSTGSATTVAFAAAIALFPRAVLNPFIGAAVDRYNRRLIMLAARLTVASCSLLLFLISGSGRLAPGPVLFVIFVRAVADTFHGKALMASTSLMVPKHDLTRIAALGQAVSGGIMFVTPALGATLMEFGSLRWILAIDIVGSFLAMAPLSVVTIPQPERCGGSTQENPMGALAKDSAEAFGYVRRWPGALGMLTISAIINFIMQPYFALIAVLVTRELGGGELEFGALGAAVGLGFVAGGLALSLWQGFRRKMVTSLVSVLAAGCFVFLSGLAIDGGLIPCLILFFGAAAMMPLCMGPIQALVQASARADIQGRVFSIMETVSTGTAPVALLIAGKVFEGPGARYWYLGGGAFAAATAVWGFLNARTRDMGAA